MRRCVTLLVGALLVLGGTVGGVLAGPAPAAAPPDLPAVLGDRPFADPSVVQTPEGYVAVSTGALVPRATAPSPTGPWTSTPTALVELPVWATGREIWAPDLVAVGGRWLLYYSVPVAGVGSDGRCIGVATSETPTGTFTPLVSRPLVCPKAAATPRAWDVVHLRRKDLPLPVGGVIDPSAFVNPDGQLFLTYRTQGFPSTIRLVRLSADGTRTERGRRSEELVRVPGTVENPVLVRRARHYVLFTSEGDYRGCRYATTWRRSRTIAGLATTTRHVLLKRAVTGVCGPGGADVLDDSAGQTLVLFHGWTCPLLAGGCPSDFWLDRDRVLEPRRAMYAARIAWSKAEAPRVVELLVPPPPAAG